MRTSIVLDDDLVAEASRLTGISDTAVLVQHALQALIVRETARRLTDLTGSEPGLKPIPRRRAAPG